MKEDRQAPAGQYLAGFIAYVDQLVNDDWDGQNNAWRLQEMVKIWHAGIEDKVPESLMTHWTNYQRSLDPEYQQYLALKKKFEY